MSHIGGCILLTLILVFAAPALGRDDRSIKRSAGDAERNALVIGNGDYNSGRLRNPVNDAEDMAAALCALGFEVETLTNADQREMETAIKAFGSRLKRGGVGLFYFAGHGVQVNGRNYLVPVGARIDKEVDGKYEEVKKIDASSRIELARKADAGTSSRTESTPTRPTGSKETERDGLFIAYDNGTVLDTKTGLMWAAKDNGENITWHDAKKYCESYDGGRYRDWRMPTLDELGWRSMMPPKADMPRIVQTETGR